MLVLMARKPDAGNLTIRRAARDNDTGNSRHKSCCRVVVPVVELSKALSPAAGCYSDTPVMRPLDWTLHIPELLVRRGGISLIELPSNFRASALPLAKSACRPPAAIHSDRPQELAQLPG
jgi:hypothetical protein